ncbi:ABC transporter permease [Pseudonocardia sp.]|uniref:ABC transporter permease n=1 Tax=Pseudonocardia sp. TaxID=60912 RepID=UPI0026120300|nr:ABC transporter permease [Pseudonocardia sp.]MCW2719650.1 rbsC [Pseudonocardia sp.]MDT7617521.1 ribose transport system permease protein [Pseudonocardiales bacterium]
MSNPPVTQATPPTATAEASAPAQSSLWSRLTGSRYGTVGAVLVILLIITSLTVPNFLTVPNLLNVLQQMAIVGVVAVGMTFVILTAGIDLSVGSILALTTVGFALFLQFGWNVWLALVAAVLIGGVTGLINGLGYTVFNIQPFVMTLATLAIAQGLALSLANGGEIIYSRSSGLLNFLGNGGIGQLSGEFIVFAVIAVLGWIALRYLPAGRYVYAVGGSLETARLSGIRVKRVLTVVYVISGCCAGLAGVMTAARLGVGEPTAGSLTNLDAIAAVVIGGTSLAGGRGSLWGSVVGALILAVIANILILMGVSPYQSEIIRGCVIIAAVLIASANLAKGRRRVAA